MKAMILGIIVIVIGLWIWLSNLGISFIYFSRDWPLLLIGSGVWLLVRRKRKKKSKIHRILNDIERKKISVEEAVKKIKE